MIDTQESMGLSWVHFGDLHITDEHSANYRGFLALIDAVNGHLAGHIDFCVLPGDNADDGAADQYALVRRGLARLESPIHIIPGDHDRKPGNLNALDSSVRGARRELRPRGALAGATPLGDAPGSQSQRPTVVAAGALDWGWA